VLPKLQQQGYTDIGVITPYVKQVAATSAQLGNQYDVATVHKFQGREKDAIVLASVDNVIGDFVDDPNMLNVAVSRAVKSLSVVISGNQENEKTNYGDLAKYITYNNFQIVDSKVFSVFDLLYKGYYEQRRKYLMKHKRVSEFDSENLAYSVIEKILRTPEFSKIDCVMHSSLATLVKDDTLLTEQEIRYASNPLTHIDILLFNKMDKSPVMAIEVDGTKYHAEGSRQAERDAVKNSVLSKCGIPILRIRTNESGERERIIAMLRERM
jgi:effector-binding domain-containing protein